MSFNLLKCKYFCSFIVAALKQRTIQIMCIWKCLASITSAAFTSTILVVCESHRFHLKITHTNTKTTSNTCYQYLHIAPFILCTYH